MTRDTGTGAKRARKTGAKIAVLLPWLAALSTTAAAFNLVSVRDEIEIGQKAQAQVKRQVPEVTDGTVLGYVRQIGRELERRATGPDYPYTFSVANYREINAFALPGGPVWVHRGAMQAAQTESQLAGVLAHEVAHIAQRHAAEQMTKGIVANGLLGFLGAVLGNDGGGARTAQVAASFVANGYMMRFSRDDEREADRVGAEIMSRAGWNPRGMLEFMNILRAQAGRNPGSVEVFFSTHPAPQDRINRLNGVVRQLGARGRTDSQAFRNVRARLARMPAARSMSRR
jgi:predicted Zn-dependent protease